MQPQDFLFLNFLAALALGVLFLRSRKKKAPSRLRFAKASRGVSTKNSTLVEDGTGFHIKEARSKNLNVIFMYNGHSWDAHEVLGVPAGSSLQAVEEHFNQALKNSRIESEEFLRAAYDAIKSDHRKSES